MSHRHIDTKRDSNVHVIAGRVLVYGGGDGVHGYVLSSVEMLVIDKSAWIKLPTPMFVADWSFSTVALP